jgi:hypothetical protein
MTNDTSMICREIQDENNRTVCHISATLRNETDLLTGSRFHVLDLASDIGCRIMIHQADLVDFFGILKDVHAYAKYLEDSEDTYYWCDKARGFEGYCRLSDGIARITLNHLHEADHERLNYMTLSLHTAERLSETIEAALSLIVLSDMSKA